VAAGDLGKAIGGQFSLIESFAPHRVQQAHKTVWLPVKMVWITRTGPTVQLLNASHKVVSFSPLRESAPDQILAKLEEFATSSNDEADHRCLDA
jgi:hypothetical protein